MITTTLKNKTAFPLVTLTTAVVLALSVTGCQKFSKTAAIQQPAPLIKLTSTQQVITPLLGQNGTHKLPKSLGFTAKKTALSQQTTAFKTAFDDQGYVNATADGTVQALDPQGKPVWQIKLKQRLLSGISMDSQSRLVIVADHKGVMLALDRRTGQTVWQTPLDTATLAPALITKNRVIALGNDGNVRALSLESGQPIWQFSTQNPALSVRGSAMPVLLDDSTVLVSTADGRVHALNTDDGVPLWSKRFGMSQGSSDIERLSDIDATPVVDSNMLYVITYSGQLVAADMASKQLSFVKPFASLKSVAVDATQLYATTLQGDVIAMDKMTGNINWQTDALSYRGLSNPVSSGMHLIVGDALGYLHVFDKTNGTLVDRQSTSSDVALLQYSNQRLIAQSSHGTFSVWQVNR